jgi:hypothetical protein
VRRVLLDRQFGRRKVSLNRLFDLVRGVRGVFVLTDALNPARDALAVFLVVHHAGILSVAAYLRALL